MSALYHRIDTETGDAEPFSLARMNNLMAGYKRQGHTVHTRTKPSQESGSPVTVTFARSREERAVLAVVEITDAAYPDHNTES